MRLRHHPRAIRHTDRTTDRHGQTRAADNFLVPTQHASGKNVQAYGMHLNLLRAPGGGRPAGEGEGPRSFSPAFRNFLNFNY